MITCITFIHLISRRIELDYIEERWKVVWLVGSHECSTIWRQPLLSHVSLLQLSIRMLIYTVIVGSNMNIICEFEQLIDYFPYGVIHHRFIDS